MANVETQQTNAARSLFVTVVAWIFIVIGGFATLLLTMQFAAFYFLTSNPLMQEAMHKSHDMNGAPQWAGFFLEHPWIFVVGFWLIAILTLIAAIGLLRRAYWARIVFIVILGIGIVWNIGGTIVQGFFLSGFPGVSSQAFPAFDAEMKTMAIMTVVVSTIFAIVISVLFGWIIKRLISPRIRAEFRAT